MHSNADLISTFNQLNVKQILSVKDMIDGEDYLITGAERVTSKYGDVVVLELGINILYLPKKFNFLSNKDIEDLSSGIYLISKIVDDKEKLLYKLELKSVPTIKDYYSFSTFK